MANHDPEDFCDYCGKPLGWFRLRAIGFTEFEGNTVPQVKAWCGFCSPDDEIDLEADAALRKAVNGLATR